MLCTSSTQKLPRPTTTAVAAAAAAVASQLHEPWYYFSRRLRSVTGVRPLLHRGTRQVHHQRWLQLAQAEPAATQVQQFQSQDNIQTRGLIDIIPYHNGGSSPLAPWLVTPQTVFFVIGNEEQRIQYILHVLNQELTGVTYCSQHS